MLDDLAFTINDSLPMMSVISSISIGTKWFQILHAPLAEAQPARESKGLFNPLQAEHEGSSEVVLETDH